MLGILDGTVLPADEVRIPATDEGLLRGDGVFEVVRPGDAVLRVLVTRGGHRVGFIEPMPLLPETLALQTIVYSPTRVLDGVKSLSYGANMLGTRLAEEQGAD